MSRELLSTGTVAARLGVSRDSIEAALRSGALAEPGLPRLGGRRVWTERDLSRAQELYAERRTHRPAAPPLALDASPEPVA